jgi:hypothetical protein
MTDQQNLEADAYKLLPPKHHEGKHSEHQTGEATSHE